MTTTVRSLSSDRAVKGYRCGTDRLISPEQTFTRIRPLLRRMGITRIANVTGLDIIGIPVVMAVRPNSRSLAVAQGKGVDLMAARVSGAMESIETYHAERIELPLKFGSYADLQGSHPLVDIGDLPRPTTSIAGPDVPILWVEGCDLYGGEPVWVPYEMVHTRYTLPLPPGSGCFAATTSGLASGNHRLEAATHALCELIERDARALWSLRPDAERRATRIDPGSVDDTLCLRIMERFHEAGVDVALWDATSDIGLPVLVCGIVEHDASPLRPLYPAEGAGCHPCRAVALLRALTEAAQSRLTMIAGSRDDCTRGEYEELASPAVQHAEHEEITLGTGERSFTDIPDRAGATFEEDVELILERLRHAGIERAIVVDLTLSAFDIPVVRAVVPGLEGMRGERRRHDTPAPGRRARAMMGRER